MYGLTLRVRGVCIVREGGNERGDYLMREEEEEKN